jgi:hypothetical protein
MRCVIDAMHPWVRTNSMLAGLPTMWIASPTVGARYDSDAPQAGKAEQHRVVRSVRPQPFRRHGSRSVLRQTGSPPRTTLRCLGLDA